MPHAAPLRRWTDSQEAKLMRVFGSTWAGVRAVASATFFGWALLLSLSAPAIAQEPSAPPVALDQLIPVLDANFRRFQQDSHVPGLIYGIVRDGQLVHVGAMGVQDLEAHRPVDANSLFRIASMSKAFTALAMLKLRDEGQLSLDALAEDYVPEMHAWRYPTNDSPRIRVRDLLSHVGGFVTDDPWGDRQQV
jgi:CubicO group peptidase (beta-lactamase class C family)